jgi:membrane peptidoglycan carboxypeptidase
MAGPAGGRHGVRRAGAAGQGRRPGSAARPPEAIAADLRTRLGLEPRVSPAVAGGGSYLAAQAAAGSYRTSPAGRYGGGGTDAVRGGGRTATLTRPPRGRPGGPGGPGWDGLPPPRKGSWWRHWTWKKALAVLGGIVVSLLLLTMAAFMYVYSKTPIPSAASQLALEQSSNVYFSNGKTLVGMFSGGVNRQMLTSAQIPNDVKQAVIAAEDRHFYAEGGISLTGIARAAYDDLFGSGSLQGGSTITQQFVRNYYSSIGTQQTITRKLKEIFVAIKLAHVESKDQILTNYLNTVYFGNNAYGIGAAAQTYFNEPASRLTISQAAMLAAMINQPGYFSPDPKAGQAYQALVARWRYVLSGMVTDGVITAKQAAAQKFPKTHPASLSQSWTGWRGYVMQAVQNELESTYGLTQQQIDTGGYNIVTTISQPMMKELYASIAQDERQMRADGTPLPKFAHVGAILEKPGTGAILAMYGGPSFSARHCVALKCQYNMAMQSRNQVGSSFKPYVLATAVSEGMDVQNSVLDGVEPMCVPPDSMPLVRSTVSTNCPAGWFPVNIPGENSGPLSVPKAAAISSDPAFEDLIHRAGTQSTINMAKKFGVNAMQSGLQAKKGEVGIALGTASLTVEEQATTFATLAADGRYATPHVIARITQNTTQGSKTIPVKVMHRQVLTPAQAADVDYALSFDTQPGGTAYPNAVLNPARPTIGKTGTTDAAQGAFFIGAIPQYSFAVGMFTNQQNQQPGGESLNNMASVNGQGGGYGGNWPAWIWRTYMQNQFANLPVKQLPSPDFNGFTKWVQVVVHKPKPKPQPTPSPTQCHPWWKCLTPSPGPSCGPAGQPCQSQTPSPIPTPSPSLSCSPLPQCPTPTKSGTGAGLAVTAPAALAAAKLGTLDAVQFGTLAAEEPAAYATAARAGPASD